MEASHCRSHCALSSDLILPVQKGPAHTPHLAVVVDPEIAVRVMCGALHLEGPPAVLAPADILLLLVGGGRLLRGVLIEGEAGRRRRHLGLLVLGERLAHLLQQLALRPVLYSAAGCTTSSEPRLPPPIAGVASAGRAFVLGKETADCDELVSSSGRFPCAFLLTAGVGAGSV